MPEVMVELFQRCFNTNSDDRPHDMKEVAIVLVEIYNSFTGQSYPRKELKAAPDSADSLNNKAVSMYDLGKQQESERLWSEAIRMDRGHEMTIYNLGLHEWHIGRIIDLEVILRLAKIRQDDTGSRILFLMGLVHMERLDAESA